MVLIVELSGLTRLSELKSFLIDIRLSFNSLTPWCHSKAAYWKWSIDACFVSHFLERAAPLNYIRFRVMHRSCTSFVMRTNLAINATAVLALTYPGVKCGPTVSAMLSKCMTFRDSRMFKSQLITHHAKLLHHSF